MIFKRKYHTKNLVEIENKCNESQKTHLILIISKNRFTGTPALKYYSMKPYLLPFLLFLVLSCSENDSEPMVINDGENTDPNTFVDEFNGTGDLVNYVTNNAEALPQVSQTSGRYHALLTDNSSNVTLHFHDKQGRLDAKLVEFPFEFVARNIGIGTTAESQTAPQASNSPYIFSGVQVHVANLDSYNSSHVVVGHRGSASFTIEGKNTLNGNSSVNDIGKNSVPDGRADIRIVGNADYSLTVYWQLPNSNYQIEADDWTLYRGTGSLPGTAPEYGKSVYVGLITYAYGTDGVPFVGTCDAIQIRN